MKKMEASKKIIIACYVILAAVLIATYAALFMGYEVSAITSIVSLVVGLVATANGFYFAKAALENKIKLSKAYDLDKDVVLRLLGDSADYVSSNPYTGGVG